MAVRRLDLIITSNATAAIRGFVNLGGAAQAAEQRFGAAGAAAARVFAAAAVGAGVFAVQSVKAFIEFDDAMNRSLAIMGEVSGPMRNRMEEAAKQVARTTTFSASEAAEAYYGLASAGLSVEQQIEALPVVAQFAQAGMMDLGTATDYLVNAQSALGLKMEDPIANMQQMQRVSDVLTKTNNIATGTVEEFAEALTHKAGGALRAANKDIEEGAAVLAAMADQGLRGSRAGEALAVVLRDVPRAAQRNSDVFREFGINIFDANGNLKNMADVVAEFERALGPMSDGEKAAAFEALGLTRNVGDTLRTLMGTSGSIRDYEAQLRAAGGTTKEVADKQMESLKAQLTNIKNRFEVLMIEFGEPIAIWLVETFFPWLENEFIPAMKDLASTLNDNLRPAFEALGAALNNEGVLKALTALAGFVAGMKAVSGVVSLVSAAFGPLLSVFGAVASVVGMLMHPLQALSLAWTWLRIQMLPVTSALSAVGSALSSIGSAIWAVLAPLAAPIGIVVAAIAALVGWIALVNEYWGKWQSVLVLFTGPLGIAAFAINFLARAFDELVGAVQTAADFIVEIAGVIGRALGAAASWVAGAVASVVGGIAGLISGVIGAIAGIVGTIVGVVAGAIGMIIGIVGSIIGWFTGTFIPFWVSVWHAMQGPIDFLMSVVQVWWNVFVAVVFGRVIIIAGIIVAFWDQIKAVFSAAINVIVTGVQIWWGWIATVTTAIWNGIAAFFGFIWSHISGVISAAINFIVSGIQMWWGWIATLTTTIWNGIAAFFGFIWNHIGTIISVALTTAQTIITVAWNVILAITIAVWNGIAAAISFVWNNIIQPIWTAIKWFIDTILVPGFNFLLAVIQAVWTGIQTAISFAWNVIVLPIWNAIKSFIDTLLVPAFNFLSSVVSAVWNAISGAITSAWNWVRDNVFSPIWHWLSETLPAAFGAVRDFIANVWNSIRDTASSVWGQIMGAVKGPINSIIGFINKLIDGINTVIDKIPGLDFKIPNIPELGSGDGQFAGPQPGAPATSTNPGTGPRFARGGVPPFITNGPRAIVGEGKRQYPEYVIPTDPAYRNRALALYESLGVKLMGIGGVIDAFNAGANWVGGRLNDVKEGVFRGAVVALLSPVNDAVKAGLDQVPNALHMRDVAQGMRESVWQWIKGADSKLPERPPPRAMGTGPGQWGAWGGGGVERWRGVALEALALAGAPASWIGSLLRRMNQESGGNPNAINLWDSNAAKGQPSQGLMQTIPSTFNAYAGHLRGRGILDPLANIYAAIRYTIARYGSGPAGWDRAGGYKNGLWRVPSDNFFARLHRDEMVLPAAAADAVRSGGGGGSVVISGDIVIQVPEGERDPYGYGQKAAKGFEDYLAERRIAVDARIK